MDTTAVFDNPAYRVEAKDLLNAGFVDNNNQQVSDGSSGGGGGHWSLTIKSGDYLNSSVPDPGKEMDLKLTLIWIQGTVEEARGGDIPPMLRISDPSSGTPVVIYDHTTLPGGDHAEIVKGAYVGVIGQLWENKASAVEIKASKIMFLGSNPLLKQMWRDEVKADRAFLLGLIEPDLATIG